MRRRYRYNPQTREVEEVGSEWSSAERRAPVTTEQLVYGDIGPAQDGSPLNSRKNHREYMRRTGLALAGDFEQTWTKEAEARERRFAGDWGPRERQEQREAIGRITYELEKRKRR